MGDAQIPIVYQRKVGAMKLRDGVNKYGTPITVFRCEYCGVEFTVVPAIPDINLDNWRGCMAPECESYDESRDGDKMLFEDKSAELLKVTLH